MRSLAKRLDRLESALRYRLGERDQLFAQLAKLSPAERRARIHFLAARIVKNRGIELAPGERIEDAAIRAIKANLQGHRADQI
jgi:hypothetical protein